MDREILHQARYWLLVTGFSFRLVPKLRLGNTYGTEAPASLRGCGFRTVHRSPTLQPWNPEPSNVHNTTKFQKIEVTNGMVESWEKWSEQHNCNYLYHDNTLLYFQFPVFCRSYDIYLYDIIYISIIIACPVNQAQILQLLSFILLPGYSRI